MLIFILFLLFLVSCNNISNVKYPSDWNENWKFNHSKLKNHQGYLKSNDTINLSIKKAHNNQKEFLRSHDIQFTVKNENFQEVVCHNERLGGNDEVSRWIYLILFIKIFLNFFFTFLVVY